MNLSCIVLISPGMLFLGTHVYKTVPLKGKLGKNFLIALEYVHKNV